jgi:hypothetical protein
MTDQKDAFEYATCHAPTQLGVCTLALGHLGRHGVATDATSQDQTERWWKTFWLAVERDIQFPGQDSLTAALGFADGAVAAAVKRRYT